MYNLKYDYKLTEINIDMEKTKFDFELLQEFAKEIKENLEISDLKDYEKTKNKIDELLVKFLSNPENIEDEIPWNESEIINDLNYSNEIDIEDEYK